MWPAAVGLANAADEFRSLADGVLVVSPVCPPLLFQTIHGVSHMLDRERAGREASPTGDTLLSTLREGVERGPINP
jgi:hypothetical protein